MIERRFHLGVDYGTSASKVIVRDYQAPGQESAFVIPWSGSSFRIPSAVGFDGKALKVGAVEREAPVIYESIKMRVAEEAIHNSRRFHYGPKPPLPPGFSARDLATLTVWWLISIGHMAAERRLAVTGGGSLLLGMTMGIPMSFFDDPVIRAEFLLISRHAWRLYRLKGLFPPGQLMALSDARTALDLVAQEPLHALHNDEVRDWIRSEAEAAMWWAFRSPSVSEGPYTQVDVGAGTTNASLFRIYSSSLKGKRIKEGLAFFAACSEPTGMDAVDDLLWSRTGRLEAPLSVRGKEDQVIIGSGLHGAVCAFARNEIWEVFRKGWILTHRKISRAEDEKRAWDHHKVLLVGGGCLVQSVRDALPYHPASNGHDHLQVQHLELPNDLFLLQAEEKPGKLRTAFKRMLGIKQPPHRAQPEASDLPFLAVAYGLSNIGIAIPEITTPAELPSMPAPSRRRERLERDDIYAK